MTICLSKMTSCLSKLNFCPHPAILTSLHNFSPPQFGDLNRQTAQQDGNFKSGASCTLRKACQSIQTFWANQNVEEAMDMSPMYAFERPSFSQNFLQQLCQR